MRIDWPSFWCGKPDETCESTWWADCKYSCLKVRCFAPQVVQKECREAVNGYILALVQRSVLVYCDKKLMSKEALIMKKKIAVTGSLVQDRRLVLSVRGHLRFLRDG